MIRVTSNSDLERTFSQPLTWSPGFHMQDAINAEGFQILAEISVALIGFTGVVVTLGHSKLSGQEQSVRLNMLFLCGAAALWGGLTPTIANLYSGRENWGLSGVLFFPVLLGVNFYAWAMFYRLIRNGSLSTTPTFYYVAIPITVLSCLWVLYGLVVIHKQIPVAQFSATTLLLLFGIYHFFILTVRSSGKVSVQPSNKVDR